MSIYLKESVIGVSRFYYFFSDARKYIHIKQAPQIHFNAYVLTSDNTSTAMLNSFGKYDSFRGVVMFASTIAIVSVPANFSSSDDVFLMASNYIQYIQELK